MLPLILAAITACGGNGPAPKVAPPPPPPARLANKLEASLAALALPDDLVLAGRWKNPRALLADLQAWSPGAEVLESWLLTQLGAPSRPIDLTAPAELIVVLDEASEPPALRWALSLGLGAAPGRPATPPADTSSQ